MCRVFGSDERIQRAEAQAKHALLQVTLYIHSAAASIVLMVAAVQTEALQDELGAARQEITKLKVV